MRRYFLQQNRRGYLSIWVVAVLVLLLLLGSLTIWLSNRPVLTKPPAQAQQGLEAVTGTATDRPPAQAQQGQEAIAGTATLQPPPSPAIEGQQPRSGELEVHVIDVGQGDSILIQAPDGSTALIDGGYDNGLALGYLQERQVRQLDAVIASHPHADHIGGLVEVMQQLPVGAVWTSGAEHTTAVFERFLDTITEKRILYHEASTGSTISVGSLTFVVLHSSRQHANLNNTSLVLRLDYGAVSFLFTGDAEGPVERYLLEHSPQLLPATVLKVSHHGSDDSSSLPFVQAVAPAVAIYSASRDNSYGHPHPAPLAHLNAVGARIYGTDTHGTVIIRTDGTRYTVTTTAGEVAFEAGATPTMLQQPTHGAAEPTPTTDDTPEPGLPISYNDCRGDQYADQAPHTPVRIVAVDKGAETVTLENVTQSPVSLDGWRICSIRGSQAHADLRGELAPGDHQVIDSQRASAIWNNRDPDDAALYDADGRLISYWQDQ